MHTDRVAAAFCIEAADLFHDQRCLPGEITVAGGQARAGKLCGRRSVKSGDDHILRNTDPVLFQRFADRGRHAVVSAEDSAGQRIPCKDDAFCDALCLRFQIIAVSDPVFPAGQVCLCHDLLPAAQPPLGVDL